MQYPRLAAKLPKKRAFITGAANGLGLAFARALANDGWTLGIADRDEIALARVAEEFTSKGVTVSSFCFDVSDFDAFREAAAGFLQAHSGIDLLINNAGIGCGGFLEDISIEDWRKVMDVNVMGAIHGCKLFLASMKANNCGHILNLASAAAIVAPPRSSPYNISKTAMVALSESLHSELIDFNITTSVFMPSFIRTEIGNGTIGDPMIKERAMVAVSESKLSAEWAVHQALAATEAGKFYIVLPTEIRVLWLFKRLCPRTFLKFIADWAKKRSIALDEAAKSRALQK